ncbi:MAG: hypothetical protein AB1646_17435 [Thermodesulfobacteriota bacterium]
MNTSLDPALAAFAVDVLERYGGLVEQQEGRILSLLPSDVAEELEIPDEASIGGPEAPLLYGSPFLDRLLRLASRGVPVVYGRIDVPYLKKQGFEQVIAEDLEFVGGQARVVGRAETRTTYLVLICHYVALSDERKEGLVEVAANETSAAVTEGFERSWRSHLAEVFDKGPVPPLFAAVPEKAMKRALQHAKVLTDMRLADFFTSMRRRLRRDVGNTVEYFSALRKEMERSLQQHQAGEILQADRLAKISGLSEEMRAKIDAVKQKYSVSVEVTARAIVRLLVPVVSLMMQIRHRKSEQSLTLTWNPVTRRIDSLACHHCGDALVRAFCVQASHEVRFVCGKCRDMY